MEVYIDGKFYRKEDAKISVFDHGLLYGDGLFEGIRVYDNCIFKLDAHLERIEYSAKAIALELPWKREEIARAHIEACRRNGIENGYIRTVITRGVGDLGLNPNNCGNPSIIIIADKIKLYPPSVYEDGMKLITVPTRRTSVAALPPMVKSLNYLNSILAKIEALNCGFDECLLLNDQGHVAECSGDNIFVIHKGKLITPMSASSLLLGITRAATIECAHELGIPVLETTMTRYDLWNADEAFLTGSAAEVVPVVALDGRKIGSGKCGPLTAKLLERFRQKVRTDGTMVK
ncbi:MAG: branched-chain-amino-acid transaminase [Opitutae bacterium]|nr:branched-chain-amino-acid transaminase [Opitutae bacterium]MCD8298666.1 branched-chain-amino-acid transaminase [Opitutae bacterium]